MLMEYLYWIFISVYVIVVVATIINVLMDNRLPVKTMAWVMVLVFMPVVALCSISSSGRTRERRNS